MVDVALLANILRTKRIERNYTQEALAAEIGISRSHLAMIETGKDLPGRETLVAIFSYFHLPLDLLAADTGTPGSGAAAKAQDEEEAAWLHAFRAMDVSERRSLLAYALSRAKPSSS